MRVGRRKNAEKDARAVREEPLENSHVPVNFEQRPAPVSPRRPYPLRAYSFVHDMYAATPPPRRTAPQPFVSRILAPSVSLFAFLRSVTASISALLSSVSPRDSMAGRVITYVDAMCIARSVNDAGDALALSFARHAARTD